MGLDFSEIAPVEQVSLLAPPPRYRGLKTDQRSCGSSPAPTGQRKGLGAWGAISLRPTEPGRSAFHPCTPLLSSPQWLKVRGKELNAATCQARKPRTLLALTSIVHLLWDTLAKVPQAQVSPQDGVSESLLPDGSAHDAGRIPWECHSVSSKPLHCPSLALGVEPASTHCEAEFPFYIGGNRGSETRPASAPAWLRRGRDSPCSP